MALAPIPLWSEFSNEGPPFSHDVPLEKVKGENVEKPLVAELWLAEGQGNMTKGTIYRHGPSLWL